MKRPVWISTLMLSGLMAVVVSVGTVSARPAAKPSAVVQLEFPMPLVAPHERVEVGYDARTIPAATGFLFVRNNLQHGFTRVPLRWRKALQQQVPSDRLRLLRGVVPVQIVRGHRLFYYGVVHDPKSGRSVRIPAGSVESAWVLTGARIVSLGTHRFGHLRSPEAVVARAGPKAVAFENPTEGARYGPWSFTVARDRSVWLLDELNKRLLVWAPGEPNARPRPVPLGSFSPVDFALGPAGSFYVTGCPLGGSKPFVQHLCRLRATGRVLWTSTLATDIFNTQLRLGPDGTLYWTGPGPSSPRTEREGTTSVWMPAVTRGGKPLSPAQQRRRSLGGYQPLPGGLRLLSAITRFEKDWAYGRAPHEERFALLDPTRGRLVRSWRVTSRTVIWPHPEATPGLVGHDLVVVLKVSTSSVPTKTEYVVLRLAATGSGTRARFSLPSSSWLNTGGRSAWGDVITDLRIGPGSRLYQLGSSPTTGVKIYRYSLAPA